VDFCGSVTILKNIKIVIPITLLPNVLKNIHILNDIINIVYYVKPHTILSQEKKKFEESKKHNKDALVLINEQRDRIKKKQSGEINLKNVVLQNVTN